MHALHGAVELQSRWGSGKACYTVHCTLAYEGVWEALACSFWWLTHLRRLLPCNAVMLRRSQNPKTSLPCVAAAAGAEPT